MSLKLDFAAVASDSCAYTEVADFPVRGLFKPFYRVCFAKRIAP